MKRYIRLLGVLLILFSSCSDFLEEKSQDLIIPKSVKDYREFLFGEAYIRDETQIHTYLDIMTDDVKENIKGSFLGGDTRASGYGYYTWQADPEQTVSGAISEDKAWETYYHSILICNITLDNIGDISGSKAEKEDLKAEAYALRAYCYFMLVNLYGQPYNQATAETDLGVPVNDVVGMEDRKFVRESVAEIYRQIESDLKEAITCFKASNLTKTCFRWNLPATYLLASRVSLYKKEYDKAIEYATYVIAAQPQLYDLSAMSDDDYFLNEKNPEILFTYGYYLVSYYAWLAKCNFPISDDLQALYGDNDWRLTHFFYKRGAVYTAQKSETSGTTGIYGYAFRTAEAYLNRAEAYAEKGDKDKALQDLKTIREKRLKVYEEVQAVTKEDVIRRVREERRRELSFEFHRWFDLRRWDRPRIEHTFTPDIKQPDVVEKYVLEKDDPAYTLPLPRSVVEYDPTLVDNPRPQRENQNVTVEN